MTLFIAESLRGSSRSLLIGNRKVSSQVWNLPGTEASEFGVNSSRKFRSPYDLILVMTPRSSRGLDRGSPGSGAVGSLLGSFSILGSRLNASVPHPAYGCEKQLGGYEQTT